MPNVSIEAINRAEGFFVASIITGRQIIIIAMHSNNFICVLILQLLPFPHQQHINVTHKKNDWFFMVTSWIFSQDLFIYLQCDEYSRGLKEIFHE